MNVYLLTVQKYSGVKCMIFYSEDEALRRMRLWAKNPMCISAVIMPLQIGEKACLRKSCVRK